MREVQLHTKRRRLGLQRRGLPTSIDDDDLHGLAGVLRTWEKSALHRRSSLQWVRHLTLVALLTLTTTRGYTRFRRHQTFLLQTVGLYSSSGTYILQIYTSKQP